MAQCLLCGVEMTNERRPFPNGLDYCEACEARTREEAVWARANIRSRERLFCGVCGKNSMWSFVMRDATVVCSGCAPEQYQRIRSKFYSLWHTLANDEIRALEKPSLEHCYLCGADVRDGGVQSKEGEILCRVCAKARELFADSGSLPPEPVTLASGTGLSITLPIPFAIPQTAESKVGRTWDEYKSTNRSKGDSRFTVCFSGITITRRHRLKDVAEAHNLRVVMRLSKSTSLLVVGPEKNWRKIAQAKSGGILILDEEKFLVVLEDIASHGDPFAALARQRNEGNDLAETLKPPPDVINDADVEEP